MNCPVDWEVWLDECLRESNRWNKPPNWSEADWREEMKAVALFALWSAICSYDHNSQIAIDQFVKLRVKAALLQRYREEWRFALRFRCYPSSQQDEESGEAEMMPLDELPEISAEQVFWWKLEVRDLLSRLSPKEHYLAERFFIDGATEKEVADELQVSQPTVSRWKQEVLQKLRQMLENGLPSQTKETPVSDK